MEAGGEETTVGPGRTGEAAVAVAIGLTGVTLWSATLETETTGAEEAAVTTDEAIMTAEDVIEYPAAEDAGATTAEEATGAAGADPLEPLPPSPNWALLHAPLHFWYKDRAFPFPQISVLLPLHLSVHAPTDPGMGIARAGTELPQKHWEPYSRPAIE